MRLHREVQAAEMPPNFRAPSPSTTVTARTDGSGGTNPLYLHSLLWTDQVS